MKDVMDVWKHTRLIVLVAITAALYAAILIPFKVITIIPGFTEIRPGTVVPILCSLMFGPAAAWGAGIGNLIGDFFGMLGPASLFGFLGNFLYGYLPYKVWRALSQKDPLPETIFDWIKFVYAILLSSMACGVLVGWGTDLLGLVPFKAISIVITINNFFLGIIISPILLYLIYPRIKKWGMLYEEIVSVRPKSKLRIPGLVIVSIGVFSAFITGLALSGSGSLIVALGVLPAIIVIFLGAALL